MQKTTIQDYIEQTELKIAELTKVVESPDKRGGKRLTALHDRNILRGVLDDLQSLLLAEQKIIEDTFRAAREYHHNGVRTFKHESARNYYLTTFTASGDKSKENGE